MSKQGQGDLSRAYWSTTEQGKIGPDQLYQRQRDHLLSDVLPQLRADASILDMGCADGEFSLLLAQKAAKVVAFDISEKLIEQARLRAQRDGAGNIEFLVSDVLEFQSDQLFDAVSLMGVLTCISDENTALRVLLKAVSLLKPDGLLILKDSVLLEGSEAKLHMTSHYEAKYRVESRYLGMVRSMGMREVANFPLVTMDNCGQTSVLYLFRPVLGLQPDEAECSLRVACYGSMPFHFRSLRPLSTCFKNSLLSLSMAEVMAWQPQVIVVADGWAVEAWRDYCDAHQVLLVGLRHGSVTRYGFAERQYNLADYLCGSPWDVEDTLLSDVHPRFGFLLTGNSWVDQVFRLPSKVADRERPTALFAPTYNPEISAAVYFGARAVELIRGVYPEARIIIKPHPAIVQHEHGFVADKQVFRDLMQTWRRQADADPLVELVDDPEASIADSFAEADILVADRSSLIFEFMALDRPMLLYASDGRIGMWDYNPQAPGNAWRDIGLEFSDDQHFVALLRDAWTLHEVHCREAQVRRTRQLYGGFSDGQSVQRVADAIARIPRPRVVVDAGGTQRGVEVADEFDRRLAFKRMSLVNGPSGCAPAEGVEHYASLGDWSSCLMRSVERDQAILLVDGSLGLVPGSAHQISTGLADLATGAIDALVLPRMQGSVEVAASDDGQPAWQLLPSWRIRRSLDSGEAQPISNGWYPLGKQIRAQAWPAHSLNVVFDASVVRVVNGDSYLASPDASMALVPAVLGWPVSLPEVRIQVSAVRSEDYDRFPFTSEVSLNGTRQCEMTFSDYRAQQLRVPFVPNDSGVMELELRSNASYPGLAGLTGPLSLSLRFDDSISGVTRVGAEKAKAAAELPAAVLRAIAFHLPQFHAVPENDEWWGKGFTEWDNVRQGRPLFDGHYQPRVPAELGYYDLSDVDALARQARLARRYGLEGFCFYYYWFDGRRLLEKPVDQLLAHPEIDLPFCLCWANENWTRRWDGGEQEVLMHQSYSPELDERFALDAMPYLNDRRYIRVNGRPLFMVYRLDIIPDVARSAAAWRQVWRREGIGEVYLVAVESFRATHPAAAGFDATCEFLPHQVDMSRITPDYPLSNMQDTSTRVGDYSKLAESWLERPTPDYKRFRGIVPSWDNSARRRKGGALLFDRSTPEAYTRWLERTVARTLVESEGDERIVFINAWNEWGEGCYLEPDQRNGLKYLEATRRVLTRSPSQLLATLQQEQTAGRYPRTAMTDWLAARRPDAQGDALLRAAMGDGEAPGVRIAVAVLEQGRGVEAVMRTLVSLEAAEDAQHPVMARVLAPQPATDDQVAWEVVAPEALPALLNDWIAGGGFDWLLLVEAGCEFTAAGLRTVQAEIRAAPGCRAVYADEVWQHAGGRAEPAFRPDFNFDFLLSHPAAVARHWLFSREALEAMGGFAVDEGQAFELATILRMVEDGGFAGLGHVSEPLLTGSAPEPVHDAATREVLLRHLQRRGYVHAEVDPGVDGTWRLRYRHADRPLVSIIIPTRDNLALLRNCVESLMEKTAYSQYELLIVDNDSRDEAARAWLAGLEQLGLEQVKVLRYPQPFNYSAMNNLAARAARGEYLLLLNNDTAVIQPEWLDEMLNHALRPEVGAVGARLLYPSGRVQHAGVVLGLRGPAEHPFIGSLPNVPGYMHRLQVDQDYSAVTAACLLIRKSVYDAVGGLDESNFAVSYNDVDLCLKVGQAGYLVVWTPHAIVTHIGSISQKTIDKQAQQAKRERFGREQDAFYRKWMPLIGNDPAYNRNLSLVGQGFEPDTRSNLQGAPASRFSDAPVVLAANSDLAGCGHYRIIQPFAAMREAGLVRGVCESALWTPAELERLQPRSLVLQRPLKDAMHDGMRRARQHCQAMVVFELDDAILHVPQKSAHRANVAHDLAGRLRAGLSLSDRMVVSTEALAEQMKPYHAEIRVVENRLPVSWWGSFEKRTVHGSRPRVGWAGGVGHAGDLEIIQDVVRELANEVDWVFLGMCPTAMLPFVKEYYLGVETALYPQRLASLGLDLALAPLQDNIFNNCKSNLRLLEYGACGYPVVCSDLRPYRESGLPVTRVRNRAREWVDAIREHLADRDELAQRGLALQTEVRKRWMLEGEVLEVWKRAWLDR